MKLILFTASYPFVNGGEQNFLDPELGHLVAHFEEIIIVPEAKASQGRFGNQFEAKVDEGYALLLSMQNFFTLFLHGVFSSLFWRGLQEGNFPFFSIKAWRRLTAFAGKAEVTRRWVEQWMTRSDVRDEDCLFYTYWFDHATAGIGLIRQKRPKIRLVSRAHNYDIYEERYYTPPFFPCRNFSFSTVDTVFSCSLDGVKYFQKKYPSYETKYQVSLLGVGDPGFITMPSKDGILRIVSCSLLRPEKRVTLLLEAVSVLARMRPERRVEWHHIGSGEEREGLQKIANAVFPPSAKALFMDYIAPSALMRFYQKHPVDVFVNVSSTEGIPVAIMEAISCGIPVIATAVGGNVEIVLEKNGMLLSENPTPDEIANALLQVCDHRELWLEKRKGSREVWQERYNETINFEAFAQKLVEIRKR